jgi:hypothetical protein
MSARKRPCAECPWRRDTNPGQFPPERYEALRETTGGPGNEAPIGSPMFACHKSAEGKEIACAGWLASVGHYNLTARISAATGGFDWPVPDASWPPLFDDYDEMASTQGAGS